MNPHKETGELERKVEEFKKILNYPYKIPTEEQTLILRTVNDLLAQARKDAMEEGKRAEQNEVNEAVKKLAQVSDVSMWTDATRTTATMLMEAKRQNDTSLMIKKLQIQAEEAYQAGIRRAREIVDEKYDEGRDHGDGVFDLRCRSLTALDAELHGNK